MSSIHDQNRQYVPRGDFFRLLIFLFVALTLFLTAHNFSDFPRRNGDYNPTQNEIVENVESGNLVRQIALLALAGAAVLSFACYKSPSRLRPEALTGRILIAFAIWSALSILWADDSMQSLKRLFALAILCTVSLAIVRMFSIAEIIQWSFVATATFLIIAIIVEIATGYFHPWLSDYRFAGIQHPNDEGVECGLLCLSGIAMAQLNPGSRRLYLTSSAVGAVFLFMTGSRTSLIATGLAFGVYFTFTGSRSLKQLILAGLLIVAACLVFLLGAGKADITG